MFPANDSAAATFTGRPDRFASHANQPECRGAFPWIGCVRSGVVQSPKPSSRHSAANFAATVGIDSEVDSAKTRPRLVFKETRPVRRLRIIVGHDLKCGGDHALKSALVLAEQCEASIRLVHVVNPRHYFHASALMKGRQSTVEGIVTRAGRELQQIVAGHSANHVLMDYDVRVGKPSMELILAGRAWQCDLMIIGGSVRPSIQILKSTAEKLIRMAFVPVLVARQPLRCQPERFLIPTDFSSSSRRAAEEGIALAQCFGGRIFFLHVFDPMPWYSCPFGDDMVGPVMIPELTPSTLKQEWATFLRDLPLGSLEWQTRTDEGLPGTGIVRYADVAQADMIVMGTHGKSSFEQMLMGSVAAAVIRAAPCPVLTVKPDAFQFRLP